MKESHWSRAKLHDYVSSFMIHQFALIYIWMFVVCACVVHKFAEKNKSKSKKNDSWQWSLIINLNKEIHRYFHMNDHQPFRSLLLANVDCCDRHCCHRSCQLGSRKAMPIVRTFQPILLTNLWVSHSMWVCVVCCVGKWTRARARSTRELRRSSRDTFGFSAPSDSCRRDSLYLAHDTIIFSAYHANARVAATISENINIITYTLWTEYVMHLMRREIMK